MNNSGSTTRFACALFIVPSDMEAFQVAPVLTRAPRAITTVGQLNVPAANVQGQRGEAASIYA
jgi:hypothetical protein